MKMRLMSIVLVLGIMMSCFGVFANASEEAKTATTPIQEQFYVAVNGNDSGNCSEN